ncbi:restriction endonuclease [Planococcus shenhongbingii]|uniref:winged helix-turn-helix domain-containing protein n=1 Tax=Planococcus shenhongbingii TaxID=3058398 RepID=UPI00262A8E7D|nr:restriction endonuclease [Planococcus sp. N016]WKA56976.1 restriction endonuclease [Planococcus sp. N016]
MTIPGYQEFMYPFLKMLEDGQEHSLRESYNRLADEFNLTEQEREELLPSGKQRILHNRVGWTRTYLKKAGLLNTIRPGIFVITERGRKVLADPNVTSIDNAFLMQFQEFRLFKNKGEDESNLVVSPVKNESTPLEEIERNYKVLKEEAKEDLLDKVMNGTPLFFEKLVVDLLVAMGYGGTMKDAGQAIGRSGDEGIDGIIKEDILGLDMIYLQAKRWENTVTRPELQKFSGSLDGKRARKGVFITTSTFSDGAKEYVQMIDKKIILIDGDALTEFMFTYNIGVSHEETFVIKKVDEDYFGED